MRKLNPGAYISLKLNWRKFAMLSLLLLIIVPTAFAETKREKTEKLVEEGDYRFEDDDLEGAEYCYRKALALQSDYAVAFRGLGEVSLAKGILAEAEEFFRRALMGDSTMATAFAGMAFVKYEMNAKDSSVVYLSKAVKLDNKNVEWQVFLAQIYRELKDKGLAIQHAKAALIADPKCVEAIILLRDLGVPLEERIDGKASVIEDLERVPEHIDPE